MKRIVVSFLLVILIIASITIPFLVDDSTQKALSNGMTIISAISSILTLVIALLLFNRFGIEQSLLERQMKIVYQLVEGLKKIRLEIQDGSTTIFFRLAIRNYPSLKEYDDRRLAFNLSIFEAMKDIEEQLNDVFMPREILNGFAPLRLSVLTSLREDEIGHGNYLRVDFQGIEKKDKDSYGTINQREITLKQYREHWNESIQAIEKWLKKHSSLEVDLNI